MSTFCSLEEAFVGPIVVPGPSKKKKRKDGGGGGVGIEHFVPAPLSSTPAADEEKADTDVVLPPTKKLQAPDLQDMFPLPGETAESEEWQKAFVLQPSQIPQVLQRQSGSVVDGKPTLWRQIPEPVVQQPAVGAPVPSDIHRRLDALTRQLESLTTPTPLQSTAELFLFVAIGLMILLAIDTLLQFASGAMRGSSKMMGGGRWTRGGGRRFFR